jgi:hypothetical protein
MTSLSLQELKKLIATANDQYRSVSTDLGDAYSEKAKAVSRYESWDRGWLFKRVFKTKFGQRRIASEEATAKATELEVQKDASRITLDIDMEDAPLNAYHLMVEAFSRLLECRMIWDINSHRKVDQWHERSSATDAIERTSVSCGKEPCDLLKSDLRVPHLPNSKSGGLYFYPGFILYTASRDAFSLIEYHEVNCKALQFAFTEKDPVPSDSQVIGNTWLYANKDGSRDRRFASNSEIPVVNYGGLNFATTAGLREEFMVSRSEPATEFASRLKEFTATFSTT